MRGIRADIGLFSAVALWEREVSQKRKEIKEGEE